jgi:hypothetical protein
VFNIPDHKENANQNDISSSQNDYHPEHKQHQTGENAGEKGTPIHCCWECKFIRPLGKAVWRFLKKLKIKLPYDLPVTLLAIYLKEYKPGYNKDT